MMDTSKSMEASRDVEMTDFCKLLENTDKKWEELLQKDKDLGFLTSIKMSEH